MCGQPIFSGVAEVRGCSQRLLRRKALVLLAVLFGSVSGARAASIQAITSAANTNSGSGFSVGWAFATSVPITITGLGKFDIGTTDDSDIAIYAAGGAMKLRTTVLATDPAQAIGAVNARYHSVAPFLLPAGNYVVFGQTRASQFIEFSNATTFSSEISWSKGVASNAGSASSPLPASAPGTWPIENSSPSRYFGPTFEYTLQAPVYTPLALTGWNQDVIAENTAASPAAGTTTDFLGGATDWVWYEQGAPSSSQGLPSSGSFASQANAGVTFQFQPYDGNNAVVQSGTVTLTNPGKFNSLAFLVSAQGSGSTWNATLNFSDNTSTVLSTQADPDWTQTGLNAIDNMGLFPRSGSWAGAYSGNLHMFEHDFLLSATDQAKTLTSISFNKISGNMVLFAVSGIAVPEPSSLSLMGLVGMAIVRLARGRRK